MKPLKPFKINKIEMFAITKPNAFRVVFASIYLFLGLIVFLLSFIPPYDETPTELIVLCTSCVVLCLIFPNIIVNSKLVLAVQPLTKMLLCKESLNRINYLLSLIGPRFAKQRKNLCSNRIACLINLGEFKLAREEIGLFQQSFDIESGPANTAVLFMNAAIIDLYENRLDNYSENIKKAYEYKDKAKGSGRINIEPIFSENYFIASHFTDDPNFEQLVLDKMNIAKRIGYSAIFARYCAIFYYYKRVGNKEKAVKYATVLLQLANGNLELYDCRKAKEYLENANKGN